MTNPEIPLHPSAPPPKRAADLADVASRPDSTTFQRSSAPPAATHRPELENLTNRQLGDFRLMRRLGRGGMADVYLAEQTSLSRRVAIKVLRQDLQTDEVHLKRFQREAIAAGGLNHPNIVQVYVIGEADGYHFIAEEYVQGLNLREFLSKKGPPDVPLALHFMRQVASAMAVAADAGIVHRDIKPENILLTRRGEVKVADFGLAQLSQAGERVELTQDGVTMGTPLYMSPEQISGRPLDSRSDIYSFGATCYHMLGGRPPFSGETGMIVAARHLSDTPEPLARRRPDLPSELCEIVHKAMAKKPDDRFADARELLAELRRFSRSLKGSPAEPLPALSKLDIAPTGSRAALFKRLLVGLLGQSPVQRIAAIIVSCLIVGALAAAVGWWLRPGNPLGPGPAGNISASP